MIDAINALFATENRKSPLRKLPLQQNQNATTRIRKLSRNVKKI